MLGIAVSEIKQKGMNLEVKELWIINVEFFLKLAALDL